MNDRTLQDLRGQVHGPVFQPGDAGYAEEIAGNNLRAVNHPDLVIGAERVEDVVAAVCAAAAHTMPLRVQATGHGTATGVTEGMLLTTRRLRELVVDPQARTARIGAGLVWSEVIDAISQHGLAAVCGSSLGVGVVGYLLGGGISPIGRTFGFAAEHVVAMEMVTADGLVRQVDAETEPELFWAMRGGQAGLGVVTSVTMNIFPLASVYGGGLYFGPEDAGEALRTWAAWAPTLTQQSTTSVALLRLPDRPDIPPPLRSQLTVHIRLAHIGDDVDGEAVAGPLRAIGNPVMDNLGRMSYSNIGAVHNDPTEPMPLWAVGRQLREFPTEAAAAVIQAAGPGVDAPLLAVEIRQFGGAYGETPRLPDAISGRDAHFNAFVIGAPIPELFDRAVPAAADQVLDGLAPWILRGPQANFHDDVNDEAGFASTWPQPTHRRLVRLKTRYDPDDLFRFGALRPAP